MPNYTKKAIRESFVKLLNQKPLASITVKDIVDDCGVNRNTFYYHFADIPSLVESIVNEDAERLIREYNGSGSLEACLDAVIGFSLENRRAVLHIFNSVNRDIYERYQWRVCDHAARTFLSALPGVDEIDPEDREIITDYLKSVCFGIVINWLEGGMKDDVQRRFHRLVEMKRGHLEQIIERARR